MKSPKAVLAVILGLAATCSLSASVVAIDYFTGFSSPTQVITSDQPTFAPIAGDPGSGVSFSNPYFFHWNTTLENYDPFLGFGGPVTVTLPGAADSFGLIAGANSGGADFFHLDFYFDALLVGSSDFLLPSGQPSATVAAAFSSDVLFNSVVLSAPGNGFMRIEQDSIKFQSVTSVPDSLNTLPVLAAVLAGFAALRRKVAVR